MSRSDFHRYCSGCGLEARFFVEEGLCYECSLRWTDEQISARLPRCPCGGLVRQGHKKFYCKDCRKAVRLRWWQSYFGWHFRRRWLKSPAGAVFWLVTEWSAGVFIFAVALGQIATAVLVGGLAIWHAWLWLSR